MNRMLISVSRLTSVAASASIVAALLQKQSSFLLLFVNSMFYIALPCILTGGFLFLFEGGFFSITRFAFRNMLKMTNTEHPPFFKKEASLEDRDKLYSTHSFRLTYPLLITGTILAALSLIISWAVLV